MMGFLIGVAGFIIRGRGYLAFGRERRNGSQLWPLYDPPEM